ncbi:MAG: YjbH domain-containing protein [Glaciecola sp.]|nr:YjbH domain-containing protein [Glaciecola sp.]MDG2099674.1 YjbH domain-containing protein [Glaciecola sp.]
MSSLFTSHACAQPKLKQRSKTKIRTKRSASLSNTVLLASVSLLLSSIAMQAQSAESVQTTSQSASATSPSFWRTQQIDTDVNVQGFGGLINVPTANTISYGELHWTFSNLTDNGAYTNATSNGLYQDGNNLTLTASPFPGLEATVRNTGGTFDAGSDLSANVKYSPTFIPKEWFSIAFGMQDLGGITDHLDSQFVVVSKDLGPLRFTAGTGSFKSNRARLAKRYVGGFYGIQYQPFEWLQLQAEHDGVNNAIAAKFKTPKAWMNNQAQLYGSVMTGDHDVGDGNDSVFYQVGLRVNLFQGTNTGLDTHTYKAMKMSDDLGWFLAGENIPGFEESFADGYQSKLQNGQQMQQPAFADQVSHLIALEQALLEHGFEDVWVGHQASQLFVRLENSLYNRNNIDAIGVALGMVANHAPAELAALDFTLSRYGVPTFRAQASLSQLVKFYDGAIMEPKLTAATPQDRDSVLASWIGGEQQPYFTPRVKVYPIVPNFIGTEIGQVDFNLTLRTNVHMPIWQGAEVYAEYDLSVARSEDFDAGGSFWKYRSQTGLKSVFARQTMQLPFNVYVAGGVGIVKEQYNEEHNVAVLEAGWQSNNGRHRLGYHYAYLQTRLASGIDRRIFTGSYRYYMPELDLNVFMEGGQFWAGDKGVTVGLSTNIGDSILRVFASETDVSIKGIGFTIPLGSRKDMAPSKYGFQARTAERFNYGLATSSYNGTNQIFVNRAYRPAYMQQLNGRYFNFDRLGIAYINENLPRLRQAYAEFVND